MTVKSAEARPSGRRGGEDRSAASDPRPPEGRALPPGPKGEATPAAHSRARPLASAAPGQRGSAPRVQGCGEAGDGAAQRASDPRLRRSLADPPLAPHLGGSQWPGGPRPRTASPGRGASGSRVLTAPGEPGTTPWRGCAWLLPASQPGPARPREPGKRAPRPRLCRTASGRRSLAAPQPAGLGELSSVRPPAGAPESTRARSPARAQLGLRRGCPGPTPSYLPLPPPPSEGRGAQVLPGGEVKVVRKGSRASVAGPGAPHAGPERSSPACVAEWTYEKGAGDPRARSPGGWTSRSGPAAT